MRVGVCKNPRPLRHLHDLQRGTLTDVTEVDREPHSVHFLHDLASEQTESTVFRFEAAIADEVSVVISELHHADPETMKKRDALQLVFDGTHILPAHDKADLALLLGNADIGYGLDQVPGGARGLGTLPPIRCALTRGHEIAFHMGDG